VIRGDAMNEQVTPAYGLPADALENRGGQACLLWIGSTRPGNLGRSFRVDKDEIVLGRAPESDLVVADQAASRRHARISRTPSGEYVLSDLGSRNGTFVNGVLVRSVPLREGDKIQIGTVTGLRFSFREELEDREERLNRALGATGVGAWEWSVETGSVALSGGADRLLAGTGGTPRELWEAVQADEAARLRDALHAAAQEERACEIEVRLATSGAPRWVALRGEPIRGADGQVTHLAGSLIDVTGRKAAEAELRRQALLFESLQDAVVVLDFDGRVIDWNGRAESMFGWAKAEALGRRSGELLAEEYASDAGERPTTTVVEGLPADTRFPADVRLRRKDGREVVAEAVYVPLKDPAGRHVADIVIYRDVTERKQMQARLLLADRMAALGTLAAGVAHEINNPLAFVLGNLIFLEDELGRVAGELPRAGELAGALREARTGAERIKSTVKDLLTISRPRDAEVVAPVDVNDAVEFALKVAEPQLRHRARVVKGLGAVPRVQAPESRLGQVLLNLLINAAQAIPEGDASRNEVRITTRHDVASGSVLLEVADTGAGIPPEAISRVFDPFYTTKPVGTGTGLGLSICHGIVTSLGGEIRVDSVVGRGTAFTVVLPAALEPAAAADAASHAAVPRAKILVVDDEPLVGSALQRLLGRRHELLVVTRASEALVLLDAGARFDMILCDLLMPDLTGMELHDKLTAAYPDQARRTVFMTGGAYTERARAFAARRAHRIVPKPVDVGELEGVLRELLEDRARNAEARGERPRMV
jgi:PAS domain S-box-containing protein